MFWQLLGQLDSEKLLIQIPNWLAEQKVGFVDGSPPTEFISRIDQETEKAILFADSASARSVMKFAHRIHQLENSLEHTDDDDCRDWMMNRLQQVRERFENRDSSEIRDYAKIPDGSTHYQLSLLDSWNLITSVGKQYVGEYENGTPATVYTLTEEGRAFLERW